MSACEESLETRKRANRDRTITETTGDLSRIVCFEAGYDHRSLGCGHGQNGMTVRFILRGPLGATQFVFNLLDMVPGNFSELGDSIPSRASYGSIMAYDKGYHSPVPMYDGQATMECELLPDGVCYYDGSGLDAGPMLAAFAEHGPHAVWAELARYYQDVFVERVDGGFGELINGLAAAFESTPTTPKAESS